MVTAFAAEVQRKFEQAIDLKHPTLENVKEFWNQVNDPSFSDEMVMSKLPIVVRKTLGLMLQQKPSNIGGHQFAKDECREWYVNPSIRKQLPALAQSPEFQMKQIEKLNEKLEKALGAKNKYDQFNMKMMEFKKDIKLVDDWIEAFSHVGSKLVRDESKAVFWAQPNSNSSNSQGDKPRRDNE